MKPYIQLISTSVSILSLTILSPTYAAWQPINNGFTESNINQIQLQPTSHSDFIYVATDFGGLYKVYNDGSYKEIGAEYFEGEKINSITIDPMHENILYVTTRLKGVLRSNDGGVTWEKKNIGLPVNSAGFLGMVQLVINPLQPNEIYALHEYYGVFHSANSGKLWSDSFTPDRSGDSVFSDMQLSSINPKNMLIFSRDSVLSPATVFFTPDAGKSWGLEDSNLYNYNFSSISPNLLFATEKNKLLLSQDLGDSWQSIYALANDQYITTYVVNKHNEQEIFLTSSDPNMALIHSLTGGKDWQVMNTSALVNSFTQLYQDAEDSAQLFAVSWGNHPNIFYSPNNGIDWLQIKPRMITPTITSLAIDPMSKNIRYAGTYSDGVWVIDKNGTWHQTSVPIMGGVTQILIDPMQPKNVLVLESEKTTVRTHLYISRDAGLTWQTATTINNDSFQPKDLVYNLQNTSEIYAAGDYEILKSQDGGATWSSVRLDLERMTSAEVIAINPKDMNEMLIGAEDRESYFFEDKVYQTHDAGKTWNALDVLAAFNDAERRKMKVSAIAFDPIHLNTIYVFANIQYNHPGGSGCLFKSIDDGKHWQKIGTGLPLVEIDPANTQSLAIDLNNPNIITVSISTGYFDTTFDNKGSAGVYISYDAGANFKKAKGLNNNFVRAVALSNGSLYAGTMGSGIWKTTVHS